MTSTDTAPQIADTLPKRTARRRKIHEDTLRSHPGKWVRLQMVSESGNASQYKRTYGQEFDFGIRRDIEHNRWLWGTLLKPTKKVPMEVTKIVLLDDTGRPTGPNYVGGSDATAWTVNGDLNEELRPEGPYTRPTHYASSVQEARNSLAAGADVLVDHSIRGTALAEDIQAVIDEARVS